ncbi:competence protein CoiA family protein [Streptomyces sp. NPDC001984]
MAFRAVHQQWGTVFAHLPDLGCGRDWEAVWRVRPPVPLVCEECRHPVHAKRSPNGLRFFAHAPGAPECAAAGESVAHHLLKLELAAAAREAGAHAEMEVRGPDGAWRADVMASDPAGAWRVALEAQLSPITVADIAARTERMRVDGVASVWFSDRPRTPWLGHVPSVRLAAVDGGGLVVREGLVRFSGREWVAAPRVPVAEFLRWVFTGRVVPHVRSAHMGYPLEPLRQVWTAPRYVQDEAVHLVRLEGQERVRQARLKAAQAKQERRREEVQARNALSRAKAAQEAAEVERAARALAGPPDIGARRHGAAPALALLADEYNLGASVGWSTCDARYAGGIALVDEDCVPSPYSTPSPA